ncbi:hypothetical protein [Candidatus Pantoea formicae]|uniref:hypothetical protein n=1 Tax=Candidatus Pantoea formicae TaxID=2608355 RepID=UPI003ED879AC
MNGNGFSLWDFFEFVIMEILPKLAFLAIVIYVISGIYLYTGQAGTDKAAAADKVPAGTLKRLSVEPSWFGDTSTLTLEDGTTVAVSGTFNPWKAGEAITTAQVKDDDGTVTYWCAGQTCLKQQ